METHNNRPEPTDSSSRSPSQITQPVAVQRPDDYETPLVVRTRRDSTLPMSGATLDRVLREVGYVPPQSVRARPAAPRLPSRPDLSSKDDGDITQPIPRTVVDRVVDLARYEDRFLQNSARIDAELAAFQEDVAYRNFDTVRHDTSFRRVFSLITAGAITINALMAGVFNRDVIKEHLGGGVVEAPESDIANDGLLPSASNAKKGGGDTPQTPGLLLKPAEGAQLQPAAIIGRTRENPIFRQILRNPDLTPQQARQSAQKAARFLNDAFLRGRAVGATVIIDSESGNFSGAILDARSLITSKHAIFPEGKPAKLTKIQSGARMKLATTWNQRAGLRYVIDADPNSDLAVVVFSQNLFPEQDAVTVSAAALQNGQPLILCASPGGVKREPKSGYIDGTQKESAKGELLIIKTNVPTSKGNSGGLVLNEKGELVGIHSEGLSDEPGSLTQVVTPEIVKNMLAHARAKLGTTSADKPVAVVPTPKKPTPYSRPATPHVRPMLGGNGSIPIRNFGPRTPDATTVGKSEKMEKQIRRPIVIDFDGAKRETR